MGFPVTKTGKAPERHSDLLSAPEVLTLKELAQRAIPGLDYAKVMDQLANLGPNGRVLIHSHNGKLLRHEVFEDPRVCQDLQRGGVIHNFEQQPADMSGWRVHEFFIDSKGCLGEVCTRCLRVCPENAIHLRGDGASSFCEIDPTACKGCFICWVECTRMAADCIQVDGKMFDSELRFRHFGDHHVGSPSAEERGV
jgi:Pyruvate/2-oxoacid:ferredoxin oxidoreductase delta subunit